MDSSQGLVRRARLPPRPTTDSSKEMGLKLLGPLSLAMAKRPEKSAAVLSATSELLSALPPLRMFKSLLPRCPPDEPLLVVDGMVRCSWSDCHRVALTRRAAGGHRLATRRHWQLERHEPIPCTHRLGAADLEQSAATAERQVQHHRGLQVASLPCRCAASLRAADTPLSMSHLRSALIAALQALTSRCPSWPSRRNGWEWNTFRACP